MSDQNEFKFVEDEVFKERLNACGVCNKYDVMSGLCNNSGRTMIVEAKLSSSSCPENKWLAEGT